MKIASRILTLLIAIGWTIPGNAQMLPDVPDGAQAVSLFGEPLFSAPVDDGTLERLAVARAEYEQDPGSADNIIWYGRRTAYTGDFRGAIRIFSEGIEKFPNDARMYRHRGHRFISIREFDRAIEDLEQAAKLIEGKQNETEPDGLPNALNIPISSLHGNIWYHLGLAYYLNHDWPNAQRAYQNGFDSGRNDDNRVSTTHWLYMIARRMGDEAAAKRALEPISDDMNVIENISYYNLVKFYKGLMSLDEMMATIDDSSAGAAGHYGVANWHYYSGNDEQARALLSSLLESEGWASFGYIAAEVDVASRQ